MYDVRGEDGACGGAMAEKKKLDSVAMRNGLVRGACTATWRRGDVWAWAAMEGHTDLSGPHCHLGPWWCSGQCDDQLPRLLVQWGSVLMSETHVTTRGHVDIYSVGYHLKPCWCLRAVLGWPCPSLRGRGGPLATQTDQLSSRPGPDPVLYVWLNWRCHSCDWGERRP